MNSLCRDIYTIIISYVKATGKLRFVSKMMRSIVLECPDGAFWSLKLAPTYANLTLSGVGTVNQLLSYTLPGERIISESYHNRDIMKYLLETTGHYQSCYTLCSMATICGCVDSVEYLANLTVLHPSGVRAEVLTARDLRICLQRACLTNQINIVKILVQAGADVNCSDGMLLIFAATNGHFSMLKLLVDNGGDVRCLKDADGAYLCSKHHPEILEYIKCTILDYY
jgi:hypothetical protein